MAEEIAAGYLRLRGFTVLEQNRRDGPREVDLLATSGGWLVIVEVRFRSRTDRGFPEESVRARKTLHLLRAGERIRHARGAGERLRFDVVSVFLKGNGLELRHYEHFLVPDGAGRFRRRTGR